MVVRFDGPLYVTDSNVTTVFADIINAMAGAGNPAEVHRNILRLCKRSADYYPSDYFKWGFDEDRFWLQQRLVYRSDNLFKERLLTVLYYMPQQLLPITD